MHINVIIYFIFLGMIIVQPERVKRYLVYPVNGIFKLICGLAIPVKLGSKQSLGVGWNLQFQYRQATNASDYAVYPPIVQRSRDKRSAHINERVLLYLALEASLNRTGINGRECVLRTICDNAMHPLKHEANGIYGQLLHIAFTPSYGDEEDKDLDPIYTEAQKAGEYGVDCLSLYPECPQGSNIMDMISLLDN